MKNSTFGINVIGHASGNLGMGVTARNIIELLERRNIPLAVHDAYLGSGRHRYDLRFEKYFVENPADLPYPINLYAFTPPWLAWPISYLCSAVAGDPNRMNVVWGIWELTVLDEISRQAIEFCDAVVAESEFIRYAFDFNIPGIISISAKHPIYFPEGVTSDRQQFGLPQDKVIFVTSFDPSSDPGRKNPQAVLAAFLASVADRADTHLIFKMNIPPQVEGYQPVVNMVTALRQQASGYSNISFFTDTLSYREVLSLYASCDVFVSLHRSEGLGLGPMEAMKLGKPVISTAWSGNMTYMNPRNACLVRYGFTPVKSEMTNDTRYYSALKAHWAEPSVGDAAAWMQALVDNKSLRMDIGRHAAEDMGRFHAEADHGLFIGELKALWESRSFLPQLDASEKARRLSALRRAYLKSTMSHHQWLAHCTKELVDRTILWRFKS